MVEYAATQGISEFVRWLMMHLTQQRNHTRNSFAGNRGAIAAPFRAGAPAGEHVGMRHRPGLRDGVRTSAKVRPAVVAP